MAKILFFLQHANHEIHCSYPFFLLLCYQSWYIGGVGFEPNRTELRFIFKLGYSSVNTS